MRLEPDLDPPWYPEDLTSCVRCDVECPTDEMRKCYDCGTMVCGRCWGSAIDAHLDCPEVPPAVNAVRRIQEANDRSRRVTGPEERMMKSDINTINLVCGWCKKNLGTKSCI